MPRRLTFRFQCPGARAVGLAGDFNRWDATATPMAYDAAADAWTVVISLPPGRHEYKFLVDGREWWNDPEAPTVPNVWGSENSFVDVG